MPEGWIFRGEGVSEARIARAPEANRDTVRQRIAFIKQFHLTGAGLWTTMANGGNPYELANLGLADAVVAHVGYGRSSINFLSFTEVEVRALAYAGMPPDGSGFRRLEEDPTESWDYTEFVVFRLRIDERRRTEIPGLYVLEYTPGHTAYVIDGREYLASFASERRDNRYADAVFRSTADKEWLVTPADPIDDRGTLSALLRKCDNLVADHYVSEDFLPDYGSTATFL